MLFTWIWFEIKSLVGPIGTQDVEITEHGCTSRAPLSHVFQKNPDCEYITTLKAEPHTFRTAGKERYLEPE